MVAMDLDASVVLGASGVDAMVLGASGSGHGGGANASRGDGDGQHSWLERCSLEATDCQRVCRWLVFFS